MDTTQTTTTEAIPVSTTTTGWSTYSRVGFDAALTSALDNGHGLVGMDDEPHMEW